VTRLLLSLVVLAALVGDGVSRADGPPAPPLEHPPRVLVPGQELELVPGELPAPLGVDVVTVPREGGLYLDPDAALYQVELRRWYEAERLVCRAVAEDQPAPGFRPLVIAGGVGVAVGVVATVLAARWR
jgi:hypothetical protein